MLDWQFECVIPGAPIGKGRPRATHRSVQLTGREAVH